MADFAMLGGLGAGLGQAGQALTNYATQQRQAGFAQQEMQMKQAEFAQTSEINRINIEKANQELAERKIQIQKQEEIRAKLEEPQTYNDLFGKYQPYMPNTIGKILPEALTSWAALDDKNGVKMISPAKLGRTLEAHKAQVLPIIAGGITEIEKQEFELQQEIAETQRNKPDDKKLGGMKAKLNELATMKQGVKKMFLGLEQEHQNELQQKKQIELEALREKEKIETEGFKARTDIAVQGAKEKQAERAGRLTPDERNRNKAYQALQQGGILNPTEDMVAAKQREMKTGKAQEGLPKKPTKIIDTKGDVYPLEQIGLKPSDLVFDTDDGRWKYQDKVTGKYYYADAKPNKEVKKKQGLADTALDMLPGWARPSEGQSASGGEGNWDEMVQ